MIKIIKMRFIPESWDPEIPFSTLFVDKSHEFG